MIGLEMRDENQNKVAPIRLGLDRVGWAGVPSDVERGFACQLATSVWLQQLGDEAARTALSDYVKARYRGRRARTCLRAALESEYRLCRERLDLCS